METTDSQWIAKVKSAISDPVAMTREWRHYQEIYLIEYLGWIKHLNSISLIFLGFIATFASITSPGSIICLILLLPIAICLLIVILSGITAHCGSLKYLSDIREAYQRTLLGRKDNKIETPPRMEFWRYTQLYAFLAAILLFGVFVVINFSCTSRTSAQSAICSNPKYQESDQEIAKSNNCEANK